MVFVELPLFVRSADRLFSDDELRRLQTDLLENPQLGALIPQGRGLRKLRVPMAGRGKRGGARVIYHHWVDADLCYLVYAHAKNEAADLSREQLQRLARAMLAEVDDGRDEL